MSYVLRTGTHYEVGLQELGEAILRESFRDAAKVFLAVTHAYEATTIHQSVAFVNGSGVETTITTFGLELNPQALRESFQWKLRHVALSSPTTLDGHFSKGASPVSGPRKESRLNSWSLPLTPVI